MRLEHILITSDLSPESLRPIEPLTELARNNGARVTLLSVVQDLKVMPQGAHFAPAVSSPDVERELEHARAVLTDQRAGMGSDLKVEIAAVAATDIAKAIVAYAKEHGVDLIAISTHGRTGLRHLALGSVAEAVLRHSPIPVLSFHRPS